MKKIYDVCFTLTESASIAIEACSAEEAERKFEKLTKEELMERIRDAVEFMGVMVTEVEEVDYI